MIALILVFSGACATPAPSPTATPSATLDPNAVLLPTHNLSGALPEGLLQGTLTFDGLCVTIVTNRVGTFTPIWPIGWTARLSGDRVQVRDPAGSLYEQGKPVALGGGEASGTGATNLLEHTFNLLGACRREPYWLVSGLAPP